MDTMSFNPTNQSTVTEETDDSTSGGISNGPRGDRTDTTGVTGGDDTTGGDTDASDGDTADTSSTVDPENAGGQMNGDKVEDEPVEEKERDPLVPEETIDDDKPFYNEDELKEKYRQEQCGLDGCDEADKAVADAAAAAAAEEAANNKPIDWEAEIPDRYKTQEELDKEA